LPGKTCANEPAAEKRLQVAKFQEAIVLNQDPAPTAPDGDMPSDDDLLF